MPNDNINKALDKLRVFSVNENSAEIQLADEQNYVSIRLDENGDIDRIHIDTIGLADQPLILRRDK